MLNRIFILLIALLVHLPIMVYSQQNEELTIERIYEDEIRSMCTLPEFKWIGDNKALLFDRNGNDEFEILNTDALSISEYFQIDNLTKLFRDNHPDIKSGNLGWPEFINSDGSLFLYNLSNDIFLVSVPELSVQRITSSDCKEKCIQISPDSKYISFVRANDIYVYDIETIVEKRLTETGSENILNGTLSWIYWEEFFGRQDEGYWWSEDSKSIAFLQTDEADVSTMHYVDFEPALPRVIKQKYPKVGEKNPTVQVGIIDVLNGHNSFIDFKSHPYEYIARVKWLPDNSSLAIQTLNRGQDTLQLFIAQNESMTPELILTETDTAWVNVNEDLYFLEDSDRFIWASERSGYLHLYLYKNNGELINQITKGDWACSSSGLGVFWLKKSITFINEANGTIDFISIKRSHLRRQLYRINFDGSGLEEITESEGTHTMSSSPSGRTYLDKYSSASTPPELVLKDNQNRELMGIAASNMNIINELNLTTPELFYIKARDSFKIPARIMKPSNFNPEKKYPVIIYIYGGPCAPQVKNEWQNNITYENVLLDNGYICVSVDHRGSTGISKSLENLMHKQMFGATELNDLEDAVRWFKKQPYVDSKNIGVWGRSGGGGNTLAALTHLKEFKAGIAVAGIADWKYYNTKLTETAMKRLIDNPHGYSHTSSVEAAANIHGRLMIIHGTYDDNVHIQNTWAFSNALINNNIKFDMMIYPMRKHSFADTPAQIHYYNTMLEFWNENLK